MRTTAFFDGGARVHQGIAAGGAVIYIASEEVASGANFLLGKTTNEAEYEGLLLALELAAALAISDLTIYGDSELVVRQVTGHYRVRKEHLLPYRTEVWARAKHFDRVAIHESPRGRTGRRRDNNARADELANRAMDLRAHLRYDETTPREEVM